MRMIAQCARRPLSTLRLPSVRTGDSRWGHHMGGLIEYEEEELAMRKIMPPLRHCQLIAVAQIAH